MQKQVQAINTIKLQVQQELKHKNEAVPLQSLQVQQIFKPYCLLCTLFMNLTALKCVGYTYASQLYPSHGVVKMSHMDGSVSKVATL